MNWKSMVSIIALIGIGFIAGLYTHRYFTKQKVRELSGLRQAKGMQKRLYQVLELEEQQKTTLQPIIEQHFEKLEAVNKEMRAKKEAIDQQFHEAITPSLTDEQKQKLELFESRIKKGYLRNRPRGKKMTKEGKNSD